MKELDPALYTIAWIAPLEIEAQAALHMLDNRHDGRFPVNRGDDYIFSAGDINGHNIIIATLPAGQEYGTGSAAALASQIKMFFTNLWCGLLVGVAAGLPDLRKIPPIDIRLGDVLVGLSEGESAGLVAYDLGKETTEGFQLLRSGQVLANTETVVRSAIGNIKIRAPDDTDIFLPFYKTIKHKEHPKGTFVDPGQERDIFYDIDDDGVDSPVQRLPRPDDKRTHVWYGSIGSGDKLTKNSLKRNEIRDRYGVIGLEMEAAGTMNRIPVGVIRGVCDYADQHKNKEWQPYAAAMAAAYAKAVIYELGPGQVIPSSSMTNEGKHALCGTILCDLPPTTDRFFGRESELMEMVEYLEATDQRRGVVLCGISGSGKTQLVREYVAQRSGNFSAILWVDASSEESIEESFSDCSSRICQHNPEYRVGRESTPPRQLVLEWLRTTPDKNWLTVIHNANGPIPNKRLLGPFMDMNHGSLCVVSTNQVTARAVRLRQILVEHLDARASQSLLLWRAYENDTEYEADGKNSASRTAKLLGGFPLALELAGVLHQRGIVPLHEVATHFTNDYPELAQFEIDSGLVSLGDVDDQSPWKQLQTLIQSKFKLNRAIDELSKIFLATKKQANDNTLLSFSLHSSICQWRLATMEDRDTWIIQATYSLSKHILSLQHKGHVFRFYNLFNRCLNLLWQHIDTQHISIYGKFAEAYFTICLCGADVYLAMGKSEISKTLFASAIDYIRPSGPGDPDESIILRLLVGLARTCENIGDFEVAEEALLSAVSISERLNGHMHDQTADLVSRLKTHRPKHAEAMTSNSDPPSEVKNEELGTRDDLIPIASPSSATTATWPKLAWELRFNQTLLVFSLQDNGNGQPIISDAFPKTIQGRLNIVTYENVEIEEISLIISTFGWTPKNSKGQESRRPRFCKNEWRLQFCDATTSDTDFGASCTFTLDNENYQEGFRKPEDNGAPVKDHVTFPPGSYSYSFELPIDCLPIHAEKPIYGDMDWEIDAVMDLPGDHSVSMGKRLPSVRIPHQLMTRKAADTHLSRQQNDGVSFCVNLPYEASVIGGKLLITVTLGPVNNGLRADYLTYSIVQRRKQWIKDRENEKADERKFVLLETFTLEESTAARDKTDGEDTRSSCDSDASPKSLFEERHLPSLDPEEPISISDDLMLPTCKQIGAGRRVGQKPLTMSSKTPFEETEHFIEVTVGGSRPNSKISGSRIQLETTEEIPITIIDCRLTHRSDLPIHIAAYRPSVTGNKRTFCGCPDAANLEEESLDWKFDRLLDIETSVYTRKVYGGSEDDVRRENARLEELWNRPIQSPSKPND
ncbi:calcium-independent phospholipase A2 [Fusarium tjaetaba]|uniref:Calcium-independent phospholipase A2 n=1 Tax=Fusarium tjaetaba TaxID=1567544 RepID=A0A8H5RHV7_9HYPO|nr:calcium-independent phospholipase A2 [Fusarium tjaetaba]KAF5633654.1 calcium-independent phospholipase A2 [Fusarium tjaetaba]